MRTAWQPSYSAGWHTAAACNPTPGNTSDGLLLCLGNAVLHCLYGCQILRGDGRVPRQNLAELIPINGLLLRQHISDLVDGLTVVNNMFLREGHGRLHGWGRGGEQVQTLPFGSQHSKAHFFQRRTVGTVGTRSQGGTSLGPRPQTVAHRTPNIYGNLFDVAVHLPIVVWHSPLPVPRRGSLHVRFDHWWWSQFE